MPSGKFEFLSGWRHFSPGQFALVLGVTITFMFPEILLGTHSFFHRDFGLFGYPLAHYHKEAFWQGEVPLWNPLSNHGIPFLAQWNSMILYPFSLIYLLLPMPWSLNVFCLGHLFMAGMGMYFLARHMTGHSFAACVAGMAFALNGLTLNCLMWPNNIAALGWMPWVVLAVSQGWRLGGRTWLIGAAAGAMQMLTGAPEIILFTWLILGVMRLFETQWGRGPTSLLGKKWWIQTGRFMGIVMLVSGLTAAQLLPFGDLLSQSQRDVGYADSLWAMPGWGWANLFVPLFGCTPSMAGLFSQDEQQWTSSYYLGTSVLAFALMAIWRSRDRRRWWLAGLAGFGLVMALGEQGYLFAWITAVFPMVGFARFPIKFVVIAAWAVPLLAALTLGRSQGREFLSNRCDRVLSGVVWAGFTVLTGALLWASARYGESGPVGDQIFHSGLTRVLFLTGSLGLLVLGPFWKSQSAAVLSRWAVIGLVIMDGWTHLPLQNPTMIVEAMEPGLNRSRQTASLNRGSGRAMITPSFQAYLDYAGHPDSRIRLLGHRRSLYPNWNLLDDVPMVNGFFSLYTRPQQEIWGALTDSPVSDTAPLIDFLGVTAVSSDQVAFGWDTRPSGMPLVTAGQGPLFKEESTILDWVKSPRFSPHQQVVLPEYIRSRVKAGPAPSARVSNVVQEAHHWRWEIDSSEPAWIVVAQTDSQWWHALVDGKEVPLYTANHAFQALEVGAGSHEVELVYRDGSFRAGTGISILSVLFFAGQWWRAGRGKRQEFEPEVFTTTESTDRAGRNISDQQG